MAEVVNNRVVYGIPMERLKRDALLKKCPEKFDMNSAAYMRLVVDAILEDRLIIVMPEGKTGVYDAGKTN